MTSQKDRNIIRGLATQWMEFASLPVMKALSEYCSEHDLKWENITGSYGMGVVRL